MVNIGQREPQVVDPEEEEDDEEGERDHSAARSNGKSMEDPYGGIQSELRVLLERLMDMVQKAGQQARRDHDLHAVLEKKQEELDEHREKIRAEREEIDKMREEVDKQKLQAMAGLQQLDAQRQRFKQARQEAEAEAEQRRRTSSGDDGHHSPRKAQPAQGEVAAQPAPVGSPNKQGGELVREDRAPPCRAGNIDVTWSAPSLLANLNLASSAAPPGAQGQEDSADAGGSAAPAVPPVPATPPPPEAKPPGPEDAQDKEQAAAFHEFLRRSDRLPPHDASTAPGVLPVWPQPSPPRPMARPPPPPVEGPVRPPPPAVAPPDLSEVPRASSSSWASLAKDPPPGLPSAPPKASAPAKADAPGRQEPTQPDSAKAEPAKAKAPKAQPAAPTSSRAPARSPSPSQKTGSGSPAAGSQVTLDQAKRMLDDTWLGTKGEKYELRLDGNYWLAMRHDVSGEEKGFRLRWDQENSCIWWGQTYFLDPADFTGRPDFALWYYHNDQKKAKARFTWRRSRPLQEQAVKKDVADSATK